MVRQPSAIASLELLQNLASRIVSGLSPHVLHNLEKYYALKKIHYLSAMEDIEGDYLEFGVFTGSSFCHSIRCTRHLQTLNPKVATTRFFGFDSFSGFGSLPDDDKHPFYTDATFSVDFEKVDRRVRRAAGHFAYKLIPGFFADSLKGGPERHGITQARIVFIDSDTYVSASEALAFCERTLQQGTFIVLDDFFSYRGAWDKGVARAFREQFLLKGYEMRHVLNYGMGGAAYVIANLPSARDERRD